MNKAILSIEYNNSLVIINLAINSFPESTKDMPETIEVLKEKLPTIFLNQCFNDENKTFFNEVQNTQTAHLFEHVILEKMALAKLKYQKSVSYYGRTVWDKYANDGFYQIQLKIPLADWPIFIKALNQSIEIINCITAKHISN